MWRRRVEVQEKEPELRVEADISPQEREQIQWLQERYGLVINPDSVRFRIMQYGEFRYPDDLHDTNECQWVPHYMVSELLQHQWEPRIAICLGDLQSDLDREILGKCFGMVFHALDHNPEILEIVETGLVRNEAVYGQVMSFWWCPRIQHRLEKYGVQLQHEKMF